MNSYDPATDAGGTSMTPEELAVILEAHKRWLFDEPREDTYDDYCEQQYEYWRDMDDSDI